MKVEKKCCRCPRVLPISEFIRKGKTEEKKMCNECADRFSATAFKAIEDKKLREQTVKTPVKHSNTVRWTYSPNTGQQIKQYI